MDHITEDNTRFLADLTLESKLMVAKLSKLACDNETQAAEIVKVMETHLQQVDETTRKYMYEVRKTWIQHVFGIKMYASDVKVETSAEPETGGDATASNTPSVATRTESSLIAVYSPEFTKALSRYDDTRLADLEERLKLSLANINEKRGGNVEYSFNYLLLDPRFTKHLPIRMNSFGDEEPFKDFVGAIFYVGQGQYLRPYEHMSDTLQQMRMKKKTPSNPNKEKRIIDIWKEGVGVVILKCFRRSLSIEAFTREACMIDAIGLDALTNMKNGSYYGISSEWSMKRKRNMGIYFLKEAFHIFDKKGEQHIFLEDIG